MISYLRGRLVEKQPMRVIIDVGGIGYEATIPLSSYDRLPSVGEECLILAYEHVREDAHLLFGFMTEPERRMFLLLMQVSGIGPKLAMSALSGLTVRELVISISKGDVKRLSNVSGIGRKTAERMVVELKDKITEGEVLEATAGAGKDLESDTVLRDAVLALISLGYKQDEARKTVLAVLKDNPAGMNVEELIRKALAGA